MKLCQLVAFSGPTADWRSFGQRLLHGRRFSCVKGHSPGIQKLKDRSNPRSDEEFGMRVGTRSDVRLIQSLATSALILAFLILSGSQSANALPAFARKYGMRCSACHETWPMLNYFGQKFKDN